MQWKSCLNKFLKNSKRILHLICMQSQIAERFIQRLRFAFFWFLILSERFLKILFFLKKFDQNLNEIKKKLSEISEKKIKLTNANPECVKDMISKTKDSLGGQLDQNSNCNSFVDVLKKMKTSGELIKVEIDREIMRLKEKFKLHEHEGSDMDSFLCSVCLDRKKNIAFSPCGHVCICDQCDVNINSCPLCRQQIATRHKVFLWKNELWIFCKKSVVLPKWLRIVLKLFWSFFVLTWKKHVLKLCRSWFEFI